MTNAPKSRKTHVVRILGTNKAGDVLDGMWLDVERIDEFTIRTQKTEVSNRRQEVRIRLKWRDNPKLADYEPEGNAATKSKRMHKILKVSDPEAGNFENPDEWVPIRVSRILRFKDSSKIKQKHFKEAGQQGKQSGIRKVVPRRIIHYDTNIDATADAVFAKGAKAYVVKGEDYTRDGTSGDDGQYVEHDIILRLPRKDSKYLQSSGRDQETNFRPKNQYLIDESKEAKLKDTGLNGINPPYRLDPFQTIINVQLAGVQDFLIAGRNLFVASVDGTNFALVPPPGEVTGAAYYGGVWVVATNEPALYRSDDPKQFNWTKVWSGTGFFNFNCLVAAGKPQKAKQPVFVAVSSASAGDASTVLISIDKGKNWSATSWPGVRVTSLNFIKGQFFLGGARYDAGIKGGCYLSASSSQGFLAVSDTGTTWSVLGLGSAVEVIEEGFSGFAVPCVLGVAYDPKAQQHIADVQQPHAFITSDGLQEISSTFTSHRSTDGKAWSSGGGLSSSDTANVIASPTGQHSIAFGNGTFAATGQEVRHVTGTFEGPVKFGPQVLRSANGSAWKATNISLPNIDLSIPGAATDWGAINFSKSAKCFLAGGSGVKVFPPQAAILISENGASWSTAFTPGPNTTVNVIAVGKLPSTYRGKPTP